MSISIGMIGANRYYRQKSNYASVVRVLHRNAVEYPDGRSDCCAMTRIAVVALAH